MTTVYVDFVGGDDGTGDGSTGNPYKTIAFADGGLSGGDEVRVKKTTVQTASDTMTWTNDSATVNTTSDESGNIEVGDAICKTSDFTGTEGWWFVSAIDTTTITFYVPYDGSTETVTTYYLHDAANMHDLTNSSGTSTASRLKITGGWDLSGPTRDGFTFMSPPDTYNTFAISSINYIEFAYFVLAGSVSSSTYNPLAVNFSIGSYFHDLFPVCTLGHVSLNVILCDFASLITTGPSSRALFTTSYVRMCSFVDFYCHSPGSSTYNAMTLSNTVNSYFENINVYDPVGYGIYLQAGCMGNYFYNCSVDGSGKSGFALTSATNNYFKDCTSTNNTQYGFVFTTGAQLAYLYDPTVSGNGTSDYYILASAVGPAKAIIISSGVSTSYYGEATMSSDTADARSGTCLKFTPAESDEPHIPYTLGTVKVVSTATDLTLKIYLKDDATFNGTVYLIAVQAGKQVVKQTEKTPTTSYVEYSLVVSSADLTLNAYLDLKFYAVGTTGNIFFDDFSWSQ